MTYNQQLFDSHIEHLLNTKRYQEATRLLIEKAGVRHRGLLSRIFSKQDKLAVTKEVEDEVKRFGQELLSTGKNSITDYIGAEVDFQTNSIRKLTREFATVNSPNRGELARAITGSPLKLFNEKKQHGNMDQLFTGITSDQLTRMNLKVRKGIAAGETPEQITKSLLATTKITESQAKTIVNTNFSQADTIVKDKVLSENSHIIKGLVFTAILDSRTSNICSSYDGLVQTADRVTVRPPLHWNCRSTLVPILKGKQELLESPSGLLNHTALESVDDNLLNGLAPIKEDFGTWLRRQPMEVKLRHLGSEEKVALLEEGTLSLKDFFSGQGNPISLAALRVKDNLLTYVWPFKTAARDAVQGLQTVSRPYHLVRSEKLQKQLADIFVNDSTNATQALSLVDYRGTTLGGKRGVRRATSNEFDPRNQTFDPFTGEIKSTYYYDPDFTLYRERVDYMRESKLLDKNQKDTIEAMAESLEDRLSVNQRSAVVENLRVVFERYAKDPKPWDDFLGVARAEMNYSVINTSRLLDRRSRARSQLFLGFKGDPNEPSVMIAGNSVPIAKLQAEKLDYERYINTWSSLEGKALARKLYYSANSPWESYLFKANKSPSSLGEQLIDSFFKRSVRSIFYRNDPIGFYTRFGKTPDKYSKIIKKYLTKAVTPKIYTAAKELGEEGVFDFIGRVVKEKYRNIVDLEFFYSRKLLKNAQKVALDKPLAGIEGQAVSIIGNLLEVVAEGVTTDYDTLAINLGKTLKKKWSITYPYFGSSLEDYHVEGSKILEYLREQGMLRINSRGVTRRSVVDLDTGRAGGNWKDTVSREVEILDPSMLQLQDYRRRIELSNRIGVDRPANKYYVVPKKKNYVDARGNDTGVSVITRSAAANFDEKTLDGDLADMLNHTMSFEYEVDPEFASFMDDLVRFKDPRGRTEYYDDLNLFREEIVRRGDQGYGLMETVRYYKATGGKFTVHARIDGRGRVYYNGYLTPTGGEVVRPFLNSAKATAMTPEGLEQLRIQMAAVIGPGTEALTTAGRLDIFKRHEKSILEIGELLSATTQRDRRIREFLEHPFMQSIEGEEVAKIARFSLEYYRIYKHTNGTFNPKLMSTYKSKLIGEADASASGLQVIALSTGNRGAALTSNVLPTTRKMRIYDLVAQDVVADPRFQKLMEELGLDLTWEDLSKASKYQVIAIVTCKNSVNSGKGFCSPTLSLD